EAVKAGVRKKRLPDRVAAVDQALQVDGELRALIPALDSLRSEQKNTGRQLGKLSPAEREQFLAAQRQKKQELQALEEREKTLRAELERQLALVPNLPDAEVPDGKDDTENVEVRREGSVREFGFAPRPHYELGEAQGWL